MIEYITVPSFVDGQPQEKKYPIRVGYYALKHTTLEMKEKNPETKEVSLEDILGKGELEAFEPLLFYSLQMGAKITGKELDIKREDMDFILDFCLQEFISKLPAFFPKEEVKNEEVGKLPKRTK